ncbi:MAG: hypothetical protein VKS61_08815 [Candidatus Sericytochromatia bacterium]|nr:hypothetical protein [Candidatus Sericytochromatia bacterium]
MRTHDTERLLALLACANDRSVFLEVAFLESWVALHQRQRRPVPLAMVARSLPFFAQEFNWRPRPSWGAGEVHHAWARLAAAAIGLSLLAPRLIA